MNDYKRSMEDIRLSDEAKKRIAENVAERFSDGKTKRNAGVSKWIRIITPVVAAAAVVSVIFLTPVGRIIFGSGAKELVYNGESECANLAEEKGIGGSPQQSNGSGTTPTVAPGIKENFGKNDETSNSVSVTDHAEMISNDKHSVSESTLARYSLNGKTPEQFFTDSIGKYNELEKTQVCVSYEDRIVTYSVVTLGSELVEYAFWVNDDVINVVSFAYPVTVKNALDAVRLYMDTNGKL